MARVEYPQLGQMYARAPRSSRVGSPGSTSSIAPRGALMGEPRRMDGARVAAIDPATPADRNAAPSIDVQLAGAVCACADLAGIEHVEAWVLDHSGRRIDAPMDARVAWQRRPPATLVAPVCVDGAEVGAVSLWSGAGERALAASAAVLVVALEAIVRADRSHWQAQWAPALRRAIERFISDGTQDPLTALASTVDDLMSADFSVVCVPSTDGDLVIVAGVGSAEPLTALRVPRRSGFAGAVMQTKRPELVDSLATRFESPELAAFNGSPAVIVPIGTGQTPRGVLTVGRIAGSRRFADDDLELAQLLAIHASLAMDMAGAPDLPDSYAQLQERLETMERALHDMRGTVASQAHQIERSTVSHAPAGPDPRIANLSEQERRVLEHVTDGLTNREIGVQMHLTEKTVRNYVTSVLSKLELQRRTQAAVLGASLRQR